MLFKELARAGFREDNGRAWAHGSRHPPPPAAWTPLRAFWLKDVLSDFLTPAFELCTLPSYLLIRIILENWLDSGVPTDYGIFLSDK